MLYKSKSTYFTYFTHINILYVYIFVNVMSGYKFRM